MIVEQIAKGLGLPEATIRLLAQKASYSYKEYQIPKRNGGHRTIHHPSKELKAVQRWLVDNVIYAWPVHPAAAAYRKGLSIKDHAQWHVASRYLVRIDFKNFFSSISAPDISMYLATSPMTKEWSAEDRSVFTDYVCRHGQLTIGAPSSPVLSNALCYLMDKEIEAWAHAHDVTYTRYADDLFFSTLLPDLLQAVPNVVSGLLSRLDYPSRLEINTSKTRHSSKRGRRQVTGIVLRSDNLTGIGRKRKRFIRSLIHKLGSLDDKNRKRLAGLLSFAQSIEPDFANALTVKFGAARMSEAKGLTDWGFP